MGVELDRKRARDDESGRLLEERRHCCSHAKEKSCRRRSSAVGEARPSTGQSRREGPSDSGEGATVSSCPMCAPEPS